LVVVVEDDMEGEGFGEAWRTTQGGTVRKELVEGREAYP
jgi:hypothetical protein